MPDCDVLVAGGGAAGLAAAIALAKAGIKTRLIGAPETIHDDGRSAALFSANLDWMDGFGAGERLRAAGAPLRAIRIVDISGALVRAPSVTFKSSEIGQEAFGWNIPNAEIIRELLAMAKDVPNLTLSTARLAGVRVADNEVTAQLDDGTTLSAHLLIGADGQNSRVREAAGITAKIKDYPQTALTCRLAHTKDLEDISLEFHTREGPFTFVPLAPPQGGGHLAALVWVMAPEKAEAMRALPREAFAAEISRRSFHALGRISVESDVGAVPMRRLVAGALTAPRIALVGEAAHAFPPIGAQGLNLGLQDVKALTARLITAHHAGEDVGSANLLSAYARARMADVSIRTAGVDLLNTALIADIIPLDMLRAAGLTALGGIAPLRHVMMRLGSWGGGKRVA
jgi:2-octaprenyl-6-methoxyphenol hydroxylase